MRVPTSLRATTVVLVLLAGGLTVELVRMYLTGNTRLIAVALAASVVVCLMRRPRLGMTALLVAGATIVPVDHLQFRVGPARTDLPEALGFILIMHYALTRGTARSARSAFLGPLLLIQVSALVSAIYLLQLGVPLHVFEGEAKRIVLYLLALPVSAIYAGTEGKRRLEKTLQAVAVSGSLYTVWVALTGLQFAVTAANVDSQVLVLGTSLDAERIRFDVLPLVFLAAMLVVGRAAREGLTWRRRGLLLLFGVVIALSFNRSTWVPLLLAILLLLALRPGARTPLRGLRTLLVAIALCGLVWTGASQGTFGPTGRALVVRLSSTTNPNVLQENSYRQRTSEDEAALAVLRRSPFFGVGLGQPYGFLHTYYLDNPPRLVTEDQLFIHNQYLEVWLALGLLGLVGFGWLGVRITRLAFRSYGHLDDETQTFVLCGGLTLLAIGVSSWFQTNLYYVPNILEVACALALADPSGDTHAGSVTAGRDEERASPPRPAGVPDAHLRRKVRDDRPPVPLAWRVGTRGQRSRGLL